MRKIIEKFLIRRGWNTYYNENYWIHTKTVKDPHEQDHTNYGMDLESAFVYEVENLSSFRGIYNRHDMSAYSVDEIKIIDYYFGGNK
jgi:hypothetical protein